MQTSIEDLGSRETEILSLAASGSTDRQISRKMGLSVDTVDSYWRRIRTKLQASSRTEAVAKWVERKAEQRLEFAHRQFASALRAAACRTGDALLLEEAERFELDGSDRRTWPSKESKWPVPQGRLFGRKNEVARIRRILSLENDRHRLVTLWGPGGTGKTRLALAVSQTLRKRFDDMAWYVPLAALGSVAAFGEALMNALDLKSDGSVSPFDLAVRYLQHLDRPALLVLDNVEHLAGIEGMVHRLVIEIPLLRILATSRRTLGLPCEYRLQVRPFKVLPLDDPSFGTSPCIQMISSLVPINPDDLPKVIELCRRLDGIPLAIEIAAAQLRKRPIDDVLHQVRSDPTNLRARFRNGEPRHRSLDRTIAWSVGLLAERQSKVLSALCVFSGGWSAMAGAAVSRNGDVRPVLEELAESSLIDENDGRFTMHETVRQYLLRGLGARRERQLRFRHAQFFRLRLEKLREAIFRNVGDRAILKEARADLDNYRSAFEWSLEHEPGSQCAFWIHSNSARLLEVLGLPGEAWDNLKRLLEKGGWDPEAESGLLYGGLYWCQKPGHIQEGIRMAEKYDEWADRQGPRPGLVAYLIRKAGLFLLVGKFSVVEEALGQAENLLHLLGDAGKPGSFDFSTLHSTWSNLRQLQGRLDEALVHAQTASPGAAPVTFASDLNLALAKGDFESAALAAAYALEGARNAGYEILIAFYARELGQIALLAGDFARSRTWLDESAERYLQLGMHHMVARVDTLRSEVHARLGDATRALAFAAAASGVGQEVVVWDCSLHRAKALALLAAGQTEEALRPSRKAVVKALESGSVAHLAQCLDRRADVRDANFPGLGHSCRQRAAEIRATQGLGVWP